MKFTIYTEPDNLDCQVAKIWVRKVGDFDEIKLPKWWKGSHLDDWPEGTRMPVIISYEGVPYYSLEQFKEKWCNDKETM